MGVAVSDVVGDALVIPLAELDEETDTDALGYVLYVGVGRIESLALCVGVWIGDWLGAALGVGAVLGLGYVLTEACDVALGDGIAELEGAAVVLGCGLVDA